MPDININLAIQLPSIVSPRLQGQAVKVLRYTAPASKVEPGIEYFGHMEGSIEPATLDLAKEAIEKGGLNIDAFLDVFLEGLFDDGDGVSVSGSASGVSDLFDELQVDDSN